MGERSSGFEPKGGGRRRNKPAETWSDMMNDEMDQSGKFLRMAARNENENMHMIDVLELKASFPSARDGYISYTRAANKAYLIKVRPDSTAETQLKTTTSVKTKRRTLDVIVTEAEALNTSTGKIIAPNLDNTDIEALLADTPAVKKIERFTRFNAERQARENTHVYKLTFNSRTLPATVYLADIRYQVDQYYPLARGCLICYSYDHLMRNCPDKGKKALCRTCGVDAGLDEEETKRLNKFTLRQHTCQEPKRCPNCPISNNEHSPVARDCPARQRENQIIRLKIDHNLSYHEAKRRYNDSTYTTRSRTYADTLGNYQNANGPATTQQQSGPSSTATEIQALKTRIAQENAEILELQRLHEELKEVIVKKERLLKEIESQRKHIRKLDEKLKPKDKDADDESINSMSTDEVEFKAPSKTAKERKRKDRNQSGPSSQENSPKPDRKQRRLGDGIYLQESAKDVYDILSQMETVPYQHFDLPKTGTDTYYVLDSQQYITVCKKLLMSDNVLVKELSTKSRTEGRPLMWLFNRNGLYAHWST